jgi:hypothetical protein
MDKSFVMACSERIIVPRRVEAILKCPVAMKSRGMLAVKIKKRTFIVQFNHLNLYILFDY